MIKWVENMKKVKTSALEMIKIFFLLFLIYQTFTSLTLIKNSVFNGTLRCLEIIIPSLYFMMTISGIIINSGIPDLIAPIFNKFSNIIFKMSGVVFTVFIFGMFAGYPIGAKMLYELYENKKISKFQAEIYLCVCYGAGPAFIFGCISGNLWGSKSGNIIILSNILSNITAAIILRLIYGKKIRFSYTSEYSKNKILFDTQILCKSSYDAGKNLFILCTMILSFSAMSGIITQLPIYKEILTSLSNDNYCLTDQVIHCIFDVSAVAELNIYSISMLPIVSGLISFGGICVIMQIKSITHGKFKLKRFIFCRIFTALLSCVICFILIRPSIDEQTVNTFNTVSSEPDFYSPVPSLMLVFMIFILSKKLENKL